MLQIGACNGQISTFELATTIMRHEARALLVIFIILMTLMLQIGACNGQISTFELATTIMRHEARALLVDHRTSVVGPFIFSFN